MVEQAVKFEVAFVMMRDEARRMCNMDDRGEEFDPSSMMTLWLEVSEEERPCYQNNVEFKMAETYTFSRALHLMRYGGKYLQTTLDDQEMFRVTSGELVRSIKVNDKWMDSYLITVVPHNYIRGSWVEVRP